MRPELTNISLGKVVFGFLSLVGVTVIMLVILKAARTERLQNMVAPMGPWAPAVYVALKASTYIVAPLSGSPLHVSAGALFGLWCGTLYSLAGDVIGGCANFWISRLLGRRMQEQHNSALEHSAGARAMPSVTGSRMPKGR